MRALRFLVFFDIGDEASGEMPERHRAPAEGLTLTPASPTVRIRLAGSIGLGAEVALAVVGAMSTFGSAVGTWRNGGQYP